ncbi:hypothetical protein V6N13_117750 [Hibiscus sabdariffa]
MGRPFQAHGRRNEDSVSDLKLKQRVLRSANKKGHIVEGFHFTIEAGSSVSSSAVEESSSPNCEASSPRNKRLIKCLQRPRAVDLFDPSQG